jgi:hypothetical protein
MRFLSGRLALCAATSFLALAAGAPQLHAQTWGPGFNPYYQPYYSGFGPGATLQGAASVISAQGQMLNQQEQARIVREQANQAKIDTQKKTFDWLKYERENTPSYTEEKENLEARRIRRMMGMASANEITAGVTLNTFQPFLFRLMNQGYNGPKIPLDPNLLSQINVTVGNQGNIGVLRDGKVRWPFALRGATARAIDPLLQQAVSDAAKGDLEPGTMRQITKQLDKLSNELMARYRKEDVDMAAFLDGKHFLSDLRDALGVLQTADAPKFLNGTFAARGNTVDELVVNMAQQGLRFAPASPGGDAAYISLHHAMVSFAAGYGADDGGFRMRQTAAAPPPQ